MSKKLFIGSLNWTTTEQELRTAFEKFGVVEEAKIITDRETGRPRGFGFVTLTDPQAADRAISEMNGAELGGRALAVDEARAKTPREGGGGFGGRNR